MAGVKAFAKSLKITTPVLVGPQTLWFLRNLLYAAEAACSSTVAGHHSARPVTSFSQD
jgi:hypothetical protein